MADQNQSSLNAVITSNASILHDAQSIVANVSSLPPEILRLKSTASVIGQDVHDTKKQLTDMAQMNSAEFLFIRDTVSEILRVITGERTGLSTNQLAIATGLSQETKHQVQKGITNQLLQSPSALKAACDVNTYQVASRRRKGRLCSCQQSLAMVGSGFKSGSFRTDAFSSHRLNCPHYRIGQRGVSFTVRMQLLPVLQKTFEVTLAAAHGAGAWSISPSMKLYNTVERSKSPLFQAFDNFISMHSQIVSVVSANSVHSYYIDSPRHPIWSDRIEFKLGEIELRRKLRSLIRDLTGLFGTGQSRASDKDQYGNTMLHVRYTKLELFSIFTAERANRGLGSFQPRLDLRRKT